MVREKSKTKNRRADAGSPMASTSTSTSTSIENEDNNGNLGEDDDEQEEGDDDDDDDQQIDARDWKHLSKAPLHLAYRRTTAIPKDLLDVLSRSFEINRDPWSPYEIKRLDKNWLRIQRKFPEFSDPRFAFAGGHNRGGKLNGYEVKKLKKKYLKFKIPARMAYKLKDRLICDVFARCRKLFLNKSFKITSKELLSKKLLKRIKSDLKKGECEKFISEKYDVSPSLVCYIKRRPKETKRFRWSFESDDDLRDSVEQVTGSMEPSQLASCDIEWKRVCKFMQSAGYELNVHQCYSRWIRLYPHAVSRRK